MLIIQLELAFYFRETLFVCVCKGSEAADCLKATCAFTGSIQSVISFLQESSRDSGPAQRNVQPLLLKPSNI